MKFTPRIGQLAWQDPQIFLYGKPGQLLPRVEVNQVVDGGELILKRSHQSIGFARSTPASRYPVKVLLQMGFLFHKASWLFELE